ncbi:MAG: bifunctional phosphoglucose/phosphomannose isomerase [Nanoarchaeota archaeon]|nr:bifunctional phosphoglucose/phosphomannose isomerase [Nanoarchaeota archaeon]MBU1704873.1 bifunctional phosphoglucose/phosphomannose isomerase [Nanoarchaeota archaeon]
MGIDKFNMLGILERFPIMCREALGLNKGLTVSGEITSIVVTGMGGSSIAGGMLQLYLKESKLPIFISRGYTVPAFVDEYTLVFAISYSGNTEETLSAVQDAKNKKAKIIAITSGGELEHEVDKVIKIPAGYQPRVALPYLFFPMIGVLYNSGLIEVRNSDLNEMMEILKDKQYYSETAYKHAKKIKDKIPIIFSSEDLKAVGYRFKTQINENAKHPAWDTVIPEMNHNEINAFRFMPRSNFIAFMLRDEKDHPRVQKRFDITRKIIEDRIDIEEIMVKGNSLLARMFSTIHLCDMISYYLALENRVDPTPVEVIERFKERMK